MANISRKPFGVLEDGTAVDVFKIANKNGVCVETLPYGAALRSIVVPSKKGNVDVVLGYETLEGYVKQKEYCGTALGRFAGRIGGGEFCLNGKRYALCLNDGKNHIHGGKNGFDSKVWQCENCGDFVEMKCSSSHMEEGYPGNLETKIEYGLTDNDEFVMKVSAVSDCDTILNLSWHPYFNLCGHNHGSIDNHVLKIYAKKFMEIDEDILPTGRLIDVEGTPLDFTAGKMIGDDIESGFRQIQIANGFDHCWVLDRKNEGILEKAVDVYAAETGIKMEVHTTQPCMQFYSGNSFAPCAKGKGGVTYHRRSGFAIETQGFTNPEALKNFSGHILKAGAVYEQKTVLKFSVV